MTLGGTEKLLINLLNHLVQENCNVTLLLPSPSENNVLLQQVSPEVEIKYIENDDAPYWLKKVDQNHMIFFPTSFAKTKNLDFTVYNLIVCFKEGIYARLFSEVPVQKILWIHNILYKPVYEIRSIKERFAVELSKIQLTITRNSYAAYNKIICVSNACRNTYLNILHDGKQSNQNIDVLLNAIDLSNVKEQSKEFIEKLPQNVTNFVLLTRNTPEKRIDRLIKASQRLKNENYAFHVYIIGHVLDCKAMKSDISTLGLDQTISLLGQIDNPYPYILQSNWLLCVSERESFSLALLESMALKTPVITTNCGGPADIVDGGKYGILVDNSTEGVYTGMKKVLDTPSLSVKYSAELDKALSRFDYNNWLSRIDEILEIK